MLPVFAMSSLSQVVRGAGGSGKSTVDTTLVTTRGFEPPEDEQLRQSAFIPTEGLKKFWEKYGSTTGPGEATGLWKKYKVWKTKMGVLSDENITIEPSPRTKYPVKNTYRYPMMPLETSDLTMKRLSGYCAVITYEAIHNKPPAEIVGMGIVNPIAESIGIKVDSLPLLYCAAANGAEMFPEFGMYSFFLQLRRHLKFKTPDTERTVVKMMRMKYNGEPLDSYLNKQDVSVVEAWKAVNDLPWRGSTRPKKQIVEFLQSKLKVDLSDLE